MSDQPPPLPAERQALVTREAALAREAAAEAVTPYLVEHIDPQLPFTVADAVLAAVTPHLSNRFLVEYTMPAESRAYRDGSRIGYRKGRADERQRVRCLILDLEREATTRDEIETRTAGRLSFIHEIVASAFGDLLAIVGRTGDDSDYGTDYYRPRPSDLRPSGGQP